MNYLDIGNQHYINKEFDVAIDYYNKIIELEPNNISALYNRGLALTQINRDEEAIESFRIPCEQKNTDAIMSRGVAYRNAGRYQEAMEDFAKAFAINPHNATAYSNYGNSLREFGFPDIAVPFFQIAQYFDPTNVNYRLNESISHLLKGDLVEGWKKYDARWFYESDTSFKPIVPGPEYDGTQDITGKRIIVYYEQGFGDSIQFIRFVPILRNMGAEVIIVTKTELYDLFKFNFPEYEVISATDNLPPYHYHVPLMDLPKIFGTTIDTIPSPEPYLSVSDDMKNQWASILGEKKKPRIGILWNPNKIAFISRFRRIELEKLLSIVDDRFEFISLSFDVNEDEEKLLAQHNVKNYKEHLSGFYNTAGLLSQLDLVISIDTVIPHLSAALGIPTYVMLTDYGCDWRWFMNRNDSPFYSCMRLFRQQNSSWDTVLESIKTELDKIS